MLSVNRVVLDSTGGGGIVPRGTRVEVFQRIFWVFLGLGTLVGVVVLSYTLYNAYVYRDRDGRSDDGYDRPKLGEVPAGGGKGKKLFLSFALSTIIVVSLIAWTYGTLLYVEDKPAQDSADQLTVRVEGYRFGWTFIYPNGAESNTLRVPRDETVKLVVTSRDVSHNFGVPGLRVKTDALPGQTTDAWFIGEETGTYMAQCYELCGEGHSFMTAEVRVMEPDAYEEWYANTSQSANASVSADGASALGDGHAPALTGGPTATPGGI